MSRERITVILVFVVALAVGLMLARQDVEIKDPAQNMVFAADDFTITTDRGSLVVGKSTLAEAEKVFPDGHMLGMSAVYRVDGQGCLLTFNREERLIRLHLESSRLATARGIRVGDPLSRAAEVYGDSYTAASASGKRSEAVYVSTDQKALCFQAQGDIITRIVMETPE